MVDVISPTDIAGTSGSWPAGGGGQRPSQSPLSPLPTQSKQSPVLTDETHNTVCLAAAPVDVKVPVKFPAGVPLDAMDDLSKATDMLLLEVNAVRNRGDISKEVAETVHAVSFHVVVNKAKNTAFLQVKVRAQNEFEAKTVLERFAKIVEGLPSTNTIMLADDDTLNKWRYAPVIYHPTRFVSVSTKDMDVLAIGIREPMRSPEISDDVWEEAERVHHEMLAKRSRWFTRAKK